jgi:hypothetical protein
VLFDEFKSGTRTPPTARCDAFGLMLEPFTAIATPLP